MRRHKLTFTQKLLVIFLVAPIAGFLWLTQTIADLSFSIHKIGGHGLKMLGDALDEAKDIITKGRRDSYGNPEDCFAGIAASWSTYLKIKTGFDVTVSSRDVCNMMITLKVIRDASNYKRDNQVDICGYASIAADKFPK